MYPRKLFASLDNEKLDAHQRSVINGLKCVFFRNSAAAIPVGAHGIPAKDAVRCVYKDLMVDETLEQYEHTSSTLHARTG